MKIACIQLNPQEDVVQNLAEAIKYIKEAAGAGAETMVLPEMFTYMGNEKKRFSTSTRKNEGVFAQFASLASELHVQIVMGSHAEQLEDPGRVFNTSLSFDKKGKLCNAYRKVHLFNLWDAQGKPLYLESDVFLKGEKADLKSYVLEGGEEHWRCFSAICYDLRFPEVFRTQDAIETPYDIVFLPAAFTFQTGKDHWEILLRARAIENQCYFVACNQTGEFLNGAKRNYGHSMVVDPWGNIVASLKEETGILYADLDKKKILEVRRKLPALQDRCIFP
jgi:predicted amidohydrolase